MKTFWQFIKAVLGKFVFLVSGSILALYYVFLAPVMPDSFIKSVIDIGLPLLCFFIACFMAWHKQEQIIRELQQIIDEQNNKKPKYKFEIIDEQDTIKALMKDVDKKIKAAHVSKASATDSMFGIDLYSPSRDSWQNYIDNLGEYKTFLQNLIDSDKYYMVNFSLKNTGRGDTNISIKLEFQGFVQEVDFYEHEIELEEPSHPSLTHGIVPIGTAHKLGNRREVQADEPDMIVSEIDRIRHDDTIRLHYNPVFIKKSVSKKKITYRIKSDGLTDTEVKAVSWSMKKSSNEEHR